MKDLETLAVDLYNKYQAVCKEIEVKLLTWYPELVDHDPYCEYVPGDGICIGFADSNDFGLGLLPLRFLIDYHDKYQSIDIDKLKELLI